MSINKKLFIFGAVSFLSLLLMLSWVGQAKAAGTDVEKDNDAISTSTTSDGDDSADALMSAEKASRSNVEVKDHMDDLRDVNFEYFLTSGYAANDIHNIPSVGHVDGTPELDGSLSVAKTVYVSVSDEKTKLDPGTKLIAFGDGGPLVVKAADFHKRFIKNLAILRVREQAGKQRYLADVVNSYDFIPAGAPVKLYDGEKNLWDKAQEAKTLPSQLIKCYVAGGERDRDDWNQNEYVILTAGTKQGIVEGTAFQLFQVSYNEENQRVLASRGWATVFYSGGSYCLAKIESGSDSIERGFEAIYKP